MADAVGKFYDHPTDPNFARALQKLILTDFPYFPTERIERGIVQYIVILTEELILTDDEFRQNMNAISVFRAEQLQKQILDALHELRPVDSNPRTAKFALGSAPPLPSLVVGREEDVRALKKRLQISPNRNVSLQVLTAIKGWPGVGKTTIASVLAYDPDIASLFPDGILWASLGQEPNIISEMAKWGHALGTDAILQAKSVEEASSLLTGLLRTKRMLLIVDDVWKVEDAIPLIVGGPACATLVTTRQDAIANALAPNGESIYRLKVLKDEDA